MIITTTVKTISIVWKLMSNSTKKKLFSEGEVKVIE